MSDPNPPRSQPFDPANLVALLAELPAGSLAAELVTAVQAAPDAAAAAERLAAVVDARLAVEWERLDAAPARA
jgi:hypothetical protein